MRTWKRALSALTALLLLLAGLCSLAVALVVIAWPTTNPPAGKADNWLIASPYIIVAAVLFASGSVIMWLNFRRAISSRNPKGEL